jgi:hypothetical protein
MWEEMESNRTCHSLFPSVYVGYIYDGHENRETLMLADRKSIKQVVLARSKISPVSNLRIIP